MKAIHSPVVGSRSLEADAIVFVLASVEALTTHEVAGSVLSGPHLGWVYSRLVGQIFANVAQMEKHCGN